VTKTEGKNFKDAGFHFYFFMVHSNFFI